MVKGKSKMSWYAEVILSYIMVTETIRYGKGGTAVHISLQAILFFSQPFSQVFITESHEELCGESDGYGLKKKNPKKTKTLRLLGYLSRKMPVDGMLQAKILQLHHVS